VERIVPIDSAGCGGSTCAFPLEVTMEKAKPRLPNLGQLVTSLKKRVEQIERDVRAIKDMLNTKDNWNSEIKDWVGQEVQISVGTQADIFQGAVLIWTDRYNICIEWQKDRIIIPKGSINYLKRLT
jgi:hypothetical protein